MAIITKNTDNNYPDDTLIPAGTGLAPNPPVMSREAYVKEYGKIGRYGGEVELRALSTYFGRPLIRWNYETTKNDIVKQDQIYNPQYLGTRIPINLVFYKENAFPHYDSLRYKGVTYPLSTKEDNPEQLATVNIRKNIVLAAAPVNSTAGKSASTPPELSYSAIPIKNNSEVRKLTDLEQIEEDGKIIITTADPATKKTLQGALDDYRIKRANEIIIAPGFDVKNKVSQLENILNTHWYDRTKRKTYYTIYTSYIKSLASGLRNTIRIKPEVSVGGSNARTHKQKPKSLKLVNRKNRQTHNRRRKTRKNGAK